MEEKCSRVPVAHWPLRGGSTMDCRAEKDAIGEGCGHWMKSMEIIPEKHMALNPLDPSCYRGSQPNAARQVQVLSTQPGCLNTQEKAENIH